MRFFLLLGVAALGASCSHTLGRVEVQYAADVAVLPLVQPSTDLRRWYIPLHSEVAGDHLLFVDTGYTYTTCDDDFVAALGIDPRGRGSVRGELGRLPIRKAKLPPLVLGDHLVTGLTCQVRDLGATSSIDDPEEVPVAGVLGMDVLRRFLVTFDPSDGTMVLTPPGQAPLPASGTGIVPLQRELWFGTRSVLPLSLDGVITWPVVDTGATDTYVDGERLGLEPSEVQANATLRGSGGTGSSVRTLVHYDIADVRLGEVAIGAVELTDRRRSGGVDGLLGLDVLGAVLAEYDWANGRARFVPVQARELPSWTSWRDAGQPAARLHAPP